ncbi:MAG TPA: EscU/YscU/HrcU family type III secretion system export apparatus switch protein, partial [Armatimonadota bacterium]|nr:EscU/YscU/HrcU family type III secretion system export apparatus switch protein [Armatimonadota bacterium]
PVVVAAAAAALAANLLQVGFLCAPKVIRLDASRLNPVNGFKRLFSLRACVELLKALLKIAVVAYIGYSTLWGSRHLLFVLPEQTVAGVMLIIGDIAYRICLKAGLALLVLALADYGFQRWQHEKDLRMTRQELRDEYKRQEGDPLLKQRIRQRQRELARRRMMAEVPKADVVITNPTHLAVALRYDPAHMDAPCVVAKGERALAERIREIAREAGVPVIENRELAQSLFRLVPVGGVIPSQLFEAVAQILAYVYRIRGKTPAFSSAA